jgi:hypothetical protein
MRKPRTLASIFFAALLAATASDASAQAVRDYFRAMTEVYQVPETIAGDTTQTGLLLIDASMTRAIGGYSLDGAVIVEAATPDAELRVGSFSVRGGILPQTASTAVFANLPPGMYRIVRMRFSGGNQFAVVTPAPEDGLSIEVRAGEATYLGKLVASQRMFSRQINYAVTADPEREAVTLRRVLARFGDTPWTPIIQARLDTLANPVAEEAPPAPPPN